MDFYFIFSPNNSGTTIICQYLQSQIDGYLPPFGNFEGQMAPGVIEMMRNDPWNPDVRLDWAFIRKEWTKLAYEAGKSEFIEGSPPNLIKVDEIIAEFQPNMKAVFSICNPYLQISSSIKNYGKTRIDSQLVEHFSTLWLKKARRQIDNIEKHGRTYPVLKYEQFCQDPSSLNRIFDVPLAAADKLAGKKNSRIGHIQDMTAKNITFLTVFECLQISKILANNPEIVSYFDYKILDMDDFSEIILKNAALAHAGQFDRFMWELKRNRRAGRKASPMQNTLD